MLAKLLAVLMLFFCYSCDSYTSVKKFPESNLESVSHESGVIIYFISPVCPLCISYVQKINEIDSVFSSIPSYAVFPGTYYSLEEIEKYISRYNLKIPVIFDADNELTSFYAATVTPEVFLQDSSGAIVYSGKIDDWAISVGKKRIKTSNFYLKNALSEYLNGDVIKLKRTTPVGCIIE